MTLTSTPRFGITMILAMLASDITAAEVRARSGWLSTSALFIANWVCMALLMGAHEGA
jgi:hypothetical protein